MRKFLLALIFVLTVSAIAMFGLIFLQMQQDKTPTIEKKEVEQINPTETQTSKQENTIGEEDVQKRLATLRNRVKLKDLIENGDSYLQDRNYMPAILNYKKALQKSPNDNSLIKKIADAYYEMYNFKKAYEYYSQIPTYNNIEKEKIIYALVNHTGVLPVTIQKLKTKISALKLSQEETFYYKNALECAIKYDTCEENFEKYFSLHPNIQSTKLQNIKTALENYKNFQSQEEYYKATYVASAFYQNEFYYVAIKIAEKVESLRSGYQPVLKMAALSAYSIGDYMQAKKYLLQIKRLNSHDPEISYYLARTYEQINEKSLAIVHYEKAIQDGHKNPIDIYRRLMFIYFEHKENDKMLNTFDQILKQNPTNVTSTDYALAVYYNILNKNFIKASKYARKANTIYKDTAIFYGYQAWISLLKSGANKTDMHITERLIKKAEATNKKEALVLMVRGIYEYKQGHKTRAVIYLKKALSADTSWEYKEEIDYYLQKIQQQ